MGCIYTLYDKKFPESSGKTFTYLQLIELYNQLGINNFSDIVFKKGNSKLDKIFSKVLEDGKDYKVLASKNKNDGDVYYIDQNAYSTQTFIDSGFFRFKGGVQVIAEKDDLSYVNNLAKSLSEEMSEAEALAVAESNLKNWELINEDAKELHKLLNSFSFLLNTRYDFLLHLKGSKFELLAPQIYEQIYGEKGLFHIMRTLHNGQTSPKIKQCLNLKANLRYLGKDIIGHYDNILVDSRGKLHIYNYKVTTAPISEWNLVKAEKYNYQLALLKQILAYNGYDVSGITMHIIPIRLHYSGDYKKINDIVVYANNLPKGIPAVGKYFEKYDTIAKYHIKSLVVLDPLNSSIINKINNNLLYFFTNRGVRYEGILKSVDAWIKHNYSYRWENRIKKVDASDHVYELYLTEDFTNPIKIKNGTDPIKNNEIRLEVEKYLSKVSSENNNYLGVIIDLVLSSKRFGYNNVGKSRSKNREVQLANSFIANTLNPYITSYKKIQDNKVFTWELISNDTLLDANILLFLNTDTGEVDVICLSDYNLRAMTQFSPGQNNIMGCHINDASKDTKGLINYKANYGNIEAIRVMTILNEVIPQLSKYDILLGSLKIISTLCGGMMELFNIEDLNKNLFLESIKIVKKNCKGFLITNNFSSVKYKDPLLLLINSYLGIIESSSLSLSEKEEIRELGFSGLENIKTREAKRVALQSLILEIFRMDTTIERMSPLAIIDSSKHDPNLQRKALTKLYILCLEAFSYYSGLKVPNEYKIGKFYEDVLVLNRINNRTYLLVNKAFTETVDKIAYMVREEYQSIYELTDKFMNDMGYNHLRSSIIGDLVNIYNNLYRRNSNGELLMEFRNPYEKDSLPPMKECEKVYLKKILYFFTKIRSEIYGIDFDFSINDINSKEYLQFVKANKSWYFNPPLERASKASIRAKGFKNTIKDWSNKTKELIHDPVSSFKRTHQGLNTPEEAALMDKTFDTLHLSNSYIMGDGVNSDNQSSRKELINSKPQGFFETNVENLMAHYLERHIQVREFNKTLISVKSILLQLTLLSNVVGEENKAGIIQTSRMILDYVLQNIFNVSIMEPESLKLMAWIYPFRQLVSKAWIAGNVVSMFRDTFEGVWQNLARVANLYQTDIDLKSLTKAYKHVTLAAFTDIRTITIIDELCKTYRLSNLDVARISEGLTTSRGGILNIESWMYATLRTPDYLNRMVLFVAKCMKDGSWEAFKLENNRLVYNWRLDKRYSIYAKGDKGDKNDPKYEELRIAYYNAVRTYNSENPERTIAYSDDLPVAYSNEEILLMRHVSNSIYGAYDKSMRAKYEYMALGMSFAMFSTWMNGTISNYLTTPGLYPGGMTILALATDGSGNKLFMDTLGAEIVLVENAEGSEYYYTETGEKVRDIHKGSLPHLIPINEKVPRVILGIVYTCADAFEALRLGGLEEFKKLILLDPMLAANIRKLLSDLIAMALFAALFKFAISPMYKDFKKHMAEYNIIISALGECTFKGLLSSSSGFLGLVAPILYGSDISLPYYELSVGVTKDLLDFAFGDKTMLEATTGQLAIFRSFSNTIKAHTEQ